MQTVLTLWWMHSFTPTMTITPEAMCCAAPVSVRYPLKTTIAMPKSYRVWVTSLAAGPAQVALMISSTRQAMTVTVFLGHNPHLFQWTSPQCYSHYPNPALPDCCKVINQQAQPTTEPCLRPRPRSGKCGPRFPSTGSDMVTCPHAWPLPVRQNHRSAHKPARNQHFQRFW